MPFAIPFPMSENGWYARAVCTLARAAATSPVPGTAGTSMDGAWTCGRVGTSGTFGTLAPAARFFASASARADALAQMAQARAEGEVAASWMAPQAACDVRLGAPGTAAPAGGTWANAAACAAHAPGDA